MGMYPQNKWELSYQHWQEIRKVFGDEYVPPETDADIYRERPSRSLNKPGAQRPMPKAYKRSGTPKWDS